MYGRSRSLSYAGRQKGHRFFSFADAAISRVMRKTVQGLNNGIRLFECVSEIVQQVASSHRYASGPPTMQHCCGWAAEGFGFVSEVKPSRLVESARHLRCRLWKDLQRHSRSRSACDKPCHAHAHCHPQFAGQWLSQRTSTTGALLRLHRPCTTIGVMRLVHGQMSWCPKIDRHGAFYVSQLAVIGIAVDS
jgi:hypothetical protein